MQRWWSRPAAWLGRQAVLSAALVLLVGLALSGISSEAAQHVGRANAQQLLNRRAAAAGTALSGQLLRYRDATAAVAGALSGTAAPGPEFTAATGPLAAAGLAGAGAVLFVVPAPAGQLPSIQAYWRLHGAAGLVLHPVGQRPEHDVIVFGRALDGGRTVAGRDLSAAPQPVRAFALARASRQTVISDTYVLLADRSLPPAEQQRSFLMVSPVYGPATAGGQRGAFRGWVALGLRAGSLAALTLRNAAVGLVNVELRAPLASGGPVVTAALRNGPTAARPLTDDVVVPVAQQRWHLLVTDTLQADQLDAGYDRFADALLFGGAGFSALLALLVWFLLTARDRALSRVAEATERLRGHGELLQAVMDSLSEGVGVVDSQGRFLLQNPALHDLLGTHVDVSAGRDGWRHGDVVLAADGTTAVGWQDLPLVQALRGEPAGPRDLVIRNPERRAAVRLRVAARPLRTGPATGDTGGTGGTGPTGGGGTTGGAVAVFHDVTREWELQDSLRQQHDRYERLLQIVSDLGEGLVVVESGRIVLVNDAFAHLLGHRVEELITVRVADLLADQAAVDTLAEMRVLLAGPEATVPTRALRLRHHSGCALPIELTGMAVDHGGVRQTVALVRDVTERERVQEELAERARQLEIANTDLSRARDAAAGASQAKSAFLAMMSHEIRTPLNAVIGLTDIVLDGDLADDQRGHLAMVQRSGETLLALINDILDWSKIEAGELELEHQPFDLAAAVRDVLDLLGRQLTGRGVGLVAAIDRDVPTILVGDVSRLRQVLMNLVGNAIKFTASGRIDVGVAVHPDPAGPAPGSGSGSGSGSEGPRRVPLRFTVSDTGIGIPADRMDRLFRDFSQVDSSTTRHYGGTGLGLAISRRIVQSMGGDITVRSVAGQGSTFTFDVVVDLPAVDHPPAAAADPAALAGRRALVVSTDPAARHRLSAQLGSWGISSQPATPELALAVAAGSGPFDVVVLGLDAPTGPDAPADTADVEQLLRLGRVVLLGTAADEVDRLGLRVSPQVPRLVEPVGPRALREAVAAVLAGRGAQGDPAHGVPAHGEPAHGEPAEVAPLRVLLVEDNPINRKVAQLHLARLGYPVEWAGNGVEALTATRRTPYDVILMDVEMPEMDGLQATRRLRADPPPGPRPWVIALTAGALPEDRQRCADAGMDDYLTKPFQRATLAAALGRVPPGAAGTATRPARAEAATSPAT